MFNAGLMGRITQLIIRFLKGILGTNVLKIVLIMSCGGGGHRMSLCPDTRVNTDQELLLNRLASSHVNHSPTAAADYCTQEVTAK